MAGLAAAVMPAAEAPASEPDVPAGRLPATPIMRWLAEREVRSTASTRRSCCRFRRACGRIRLLGALQAVLDHHDGLRLRSLAARAAILALEVAPPGAR